MKDLFFINIGLSDNETKKAIVVGRKNAIKTFEKLKKQESYTWISINETYKSVDGFLEQGECICYETPE